MVERFSRWVTSVLSARWSRSRGAALVVAAVGVTSLGCGAYEPEPEYPQQYSYVAPTPPTAEELAAQQQARQQAAAESREILVGAEGDEYSDTDPSALTEFKPALEGHGTWIDDPSYGTVWVPSREEVGADFQPYVTVGHWTYSEATDYVWVSDYSWGWAPFHYGRWVHLPNHGWAWIPGRRYAGAWVTWRVGPAGYGYVGWAPAPPSWYWHGGVAYGWSFGWYRHHDHYVYCSRDYIHHPTMPTHVVRGPAAHEHHGRTQDYVPARPGVGAGGDRVVANPSVNGSDRVVANPSVGGKRTVANPVVGPRPDEIGVKNEAVVPPPASNQGLARARAFAAPSTAVAAGAAPPAHLRPRATFAEPPTVSGSMNRGPASPAFVPDGARGIAGAPRQPSTTPSPTVTPPSAFRQPPSYSAPSITPPSAFRQPPSYSAAPSVTPPPVYRQQQPPSYSPPPRPISPPASAYRQGPSYSATPSYRQPPPAVFRSTPATPSFRSSPPPVVRPAPSFGGSSPSFRSSPTPSFRPSSPAVRSPSFSASPSFRSAAPAVRAPSIRATPSTPSRSAAPALRASPGIRRR